MKAFKINLFHVSPYAGSNDMQYKVLYKTDIDFAVFNGTVQMWTFKSNLVSIISYASNNGTTYQNNLTKVYPKPTFMKKAMIWKHFRYYWPFVRRIHLVSISKKCGVDILHVKSQ